MLHRVFWLYPILLVILMSACAPTYYGVSEEVWSQMTEEQQLEAIKGYNERRKIRERRRQEQARLARIEKEQEDRERQARVDAIYRGEAGRIGDLLRVSIENGKMRVGGKHRSYTPVSFTIADGEYKIIPLYSGSKYIRHSGEFEVHYHEGSLLLDIRDDSFYKAAVIVYKPEWRKGKTHEKINSGGPADFENVSVTVQALPVRRHGHH